MDNEVKCWCKHCGIELPPSHTGPCPKCGKIGKHYTAIASAVVEIHSSMTARQKRKGFPKFIKEIIQGRFPSVNPKLKKGVDKVRIIDKEKNEYHEVVKNAETGEITREVHEPLSQHRHGNPNWVWWSFFKERTRQLLSRLWKILTAYSVGILILSAMFNILALVYSNGEALSIEAVSALSFLNSIFATVALGLAVAIFTLSFILLFALSLFPKGRQLADKTFKFPEFTELEKFKNKVDGELAVINKRLGYVEKRLENFETTVQKPKAQEAKVMGTKGRKNIRKPKMTKEQKEARKKKRK